MVTLLSLSFFFPLLGFPSHGASPLVADAEFWISRSSSLTGLLFLTKLSFPPTELHDFVTSPGDALSCSSRSDGHL